jgi:hypothetical protein
MGVEGVVGRIRIELGRPQRIDNQRIHRPPGGGSQANVGR